MFVMRTICLAVLLGSVSAFWAAASTLTLGTLHESIREQTREYDHLLTYLEQELTEAGIKDVQLVVHTTIEVMASAMARGEVDIFIDSPLVAAKVAKASGATPFLRHWKDGTSSYYCVIIVHVDSGIETIADLSGHVIAFEDIASTTGFILPAHLLVQSGLRLRQTRRAKPKVEPNTVSYYFTHRDDNTLYALATGRADAGATDQKSFLHLEAARPGQFKVIASSEAVPRSVLLHRAGIDQALVGQLKAVLTTMFRSEGGRETLKSFQNSAGFDEFPEGAKATFKPIFQILQDLEDAGIR